MGRQMGRALALAEKTGRSRGLYGRSGAWLGIWVAAAGYRHLRKWFEEEPVVVRETLKPGQQLVITHYKKGDDPPVPVESLGRRARRKAVKAAKKAKRGGKRSGGGVIEASLSTIDE